MSEHKEERKMTLAEFDRLPENNMQIYELIDGTLTMQARPGATHQKIMALLTARLVNHFTGGPCTTFTEFEVQLGNDILVPDISVICEKEKITSKRCVGAPALTIEIISPSSLRMDYMIKLNQYERFGVHEYWIVNPSTKAILVHNFQQKTVDEFVYHETLHSREFPGLKLIMKDIFDK